MRLPLAVPGFMLTLAASAHVAAQSPLPSQQPEGAATPAAAPATEQSREEFRRASAFAKEQRWQEAHEAYRNAQRLYPHATTLLNLGYCEEQLGNAAAAYRETMAALYFSKQHPERGLDAKRSTEARATLRALDSRIARVELQPANDVVALSVDGSPLLAMADEARTLLFVAAEAPREAPRLERGGTLFVPPGRHRLVLKTSAGEATHDLDLAAGAAVTLAWPAPRRAESAPAITATAVAPPASAASGSRSTAVTDSQPFRPWAIGSFAVGGAALVTAVVTGVMATSAKGDLDQACTPQGSCPPSAAETIDRFELTSTIAAVAIASAAVATAAGFTLLLIEGPSESSARLGLRVTPLGRVGVAGRF